MRRARIHRPQIATALLFALLGGCGKGSGPTRPNAVVPPPAVGHVIAGRVLGSNGQPMRDAVVTLEPLTGAIPARAVRVRTARDRARAQATDLTGTSEDVRVAVTGSDGRFGFATVENGDYACSGRASHHLAATRAVTIGSASADTTFVILQLTPAGTFSGKALLESASEHGGIVVFAPGTSYVAVTDTAGEYLLRDLPLGTWTLEAMRSGWLDATTGGTLVNAGDSVRLATMTLRRDRNLPPVANAGATCSGSCNACRPVSLVASDSHDPDGTIVRWEWDFDDDGVQDYSSTTTGTTSHVFPPGSSRPRLTVTDDHGAIGVAVVPITVAANQAPTAVAQTTCAAKCYAGSPTTLRGASSSDPDGTIQFFAWDFESDGSYDTGNLPPGDVTHTYAIGTHTAKLRVTDDCGATATSTVTFSVANNQPPVAMGGINCGAGGCREGTSISFNATGSSDPDGTIVAWKWDFENDGIEDFASSVTGTTSHSYPLEGSYVAKLTVQDDQGATGSILVNVPVTGAPFTGDTAYVSATANPVGAIGTRSHPFANLFSALAALNPTGVRTVRVTTGTYTQDLVLPSSIVIQGGLDPATWTRTPGSYSVLATGPEGVTAYSVGSTTVSGFEFRSLQGINAGEASTAMRIASSTSTLVFNDCRFVAGLGAPGANGGPGTAGTDGAPGLAGSPGCVDCASGGSGGAAGSSGTHPGGAGGRGGSNANGTQGSNGWGYLVGPQSGGGTGGDAATSCGTQGAPGIAGVAGAVGGRGAFGASGNGTGGVVNGAWAPSSGTGGGSGYQGNGGGGGGGGGGSFQSASCSADGGGGGGGGGAGGAGGTGGTAATSGGASIAVVLDGATPIFNSCTFITANGGKGGLGGAGGAGGAGGTGGAGGAASTDGGAGGPGGAGGKGGAGGGGAGGAGGPSWCVFRKQPTAATFISCTFSHGSGGAGGAHGTPGAAAGPPGTSGDVYP